LTRVASNCYSYCHILILLCPARPLPNTAMPLPNAACPYRDQPSGPWQHVFPDRLRLSTLTELETAYGPPWEAADLNRLVSSCGCLQKLSLCCTPGLQLTALLQLTDLVQLWLTGTTDSCTIASLAQLTGLCRLQRLAVTDACVFSSKLFIPLTALTQLTYLALPYYLGDGSTTEQLLLEHCGSPSPVVRWPSGLCPVITSTVSGHSRIHMNSWVAWG